jgi:hypothetical protein
MLLIGFPAILSWFYRFDELSPLVVAMLNPLFALAGILNTSERTGTPMSGAVFGWPQIVTYLVLTWVFLAWATRTLTKADNEEIRSPRKRRNA